MDYCALYNICNSTAGVDVLLGSGAPSRTIPLQDDDGVIRYYPQAAVRQMSFPPGQAPSFSGNDMSIEFNSKANFYFDGSDENSKIGHDQYSFLTVAIHEYVPG